MKRFIIILLITLIINPIYNLSANNLSIIALVNGDIITNYDVEARIKINKRLSKIKDNKTPVLNNSEKKAALLEMIIEKIKMHEAYNKGISITEGEIKEAIARLENKHDYPKGYILETAENLGYSEDIIKKQIASDILWLKLIQSQITPRVKINETDVANKLEELNSGSSQHINVSHIIAGDKENAEEIYNKVKDLSSCEKFNEIANEEGNSGSGTLGTISISDLSENIKKGIKGLELKTASKPVQTNEENYSIFMVCSYEKAEIPQEIEDQIRNMLMQQEIEKAAFMHLKDLKDLSIIEIKDPYYEDVLNELEKQ